MQFYIPRAARQTKSGFHPHHFSILVEHFSHPRWVSDLSETEAGNWTMVLKAPSCFSLGRETALAKVKGAFVFEQLSDDERSALKERDGSLLLDLGWEVLFPREEIVDGLIAAVTEFAINTRKLFILHCNQIARVQFENIWRKKVSLPPPLSMEYPTALALLVIYQDKRRNDDAIAARRETALRSTLENRRSHLFVSFNGEVRPHRLYVAASLLRLGILDRGHVSLLSYRKGQSESRDQFRDRSLRVMRKYPGGADLDTAAEELLDRLPLRLDIDMPSSTDLENVAWESQNPALYDDSHFTAVIDTTVTDEHMLFVTEKVLKPLMNHSPFIFMGNPGGISLLRNYGFETFEPELMQPAALDPKFILSAGVEEMARLSQFSPTELAVFSRSLIERCDHNARHFWTGFPILLEKLFETQILRPLSQP